ncbi:MAG: cytochrome c [Pseudomonadota bacterium]
MTAAAGCVSCHAANYSDPPVLDGGVEIASPFGAIITPNITPDKKAGIGDWSKTEFLNAVKRGVSPVGEHYYPAFPYMHYRGLTDRDVLDIHAYLSSLPASDKVNNPTQLPFPFSVRRGIGVWKRIDALELRERRDAAVLERGRYLVEHAAHCGACHTPRTVLLTSDHSDAFRGSVLFDGAIAPPLTRERLLAAGEDAFVTGALVYGLRLDGSALEDRKMIEVVDQTRRLTQDDRKAIFDYLSSLE